MAIHHSAPRLAAVARGPLPLLLALVLGALVVGLTHADYGPTWDEAIQARYGELAVAYFASGGTDARCNDYLDLRYYGPLVEMIPALLGTPEGVDRYERRHLLLGLLALLVLPAAWVYARRFGCRRLALFALPAVTLQPRFYGHWFNNSKDLPFAVLTLWFLVAAAGLATRRDASWGRIGLCGVAMGLALCVRPGGLPLLLAYLAGALAIRAVSIGRSTPEDWPAAIARWTPRVLVLVALAWSIMVLPWPWAHRAPLTHPLEAMRVAADFPTRMPVLFAGETIPSDRLPPTYPLHYLLVTTPVTVLLLASIGLGLGWRRRADRPPLQAPMLALTALWLFLPLLVFAAWRPNVYGGMRHFLFVVPALGILAAVGANEVVAASPTLGMRRLATLLLAVALLAPLLPMVRLHPYQATYYNATVGGVAGASGRYWTDYSLSSYAEAIRWIDRQPRDPQQEITVVLAGGPPILAWARSYAAPGIRLQLLRDYPGRDRRGMSPGDYYVGTTRLDADRRFPASPVVHTVGRAGAVFTVVRKGRSNPQRERLDR